jgi:hypothetical protein
MVAPFAGALWGFAALFDCAAKEDTATTSASKTGRIDRLRQGLDMLIRAERTTSLLERQRYVCYLR